MENLVLPVRKGGLGNQMFQVAAGLIYAKETGRQILLPFEFYNSHRTANEDYADTLFKNIPLRIEKALDQTAIDALKRNGFTQYPGEPGFDPWIVNRQLSGNVLLHGYFQYYPPLESHEELIRNFYLDGLAPYKDNLIANRNRVGIHVRRGDYLKPPFNDVHKTQDGLYYKKALSLFNPGYIDEYWIFSDDIEWCKQQDVFQELSNCRFIDEPHELRSLARMTLCQGGFICAASTFSWWGAFLGAYGQRSPCIVPIPWIKGHDTNFLFPREWIQIQT